MDNRITVVVGTDGSVIATKQDGVFRRSNESKQLVALISYPSDCIVSANFIRADGVKPKSRGLAYTGQQEYDGEVYSAYMYELRLPVVRIGAACRVAGYKGRRNASGCRQFCH